MNVLGLSFDFHDSSAALVVDGRVLAAASEERFTRQKHDANFPELAIAFCLEKAGLELNDIDQVVFYERPGKKWTRILASALAAWPHSRREFSQSMKAWFGKKLWTKALLVRRLGIDPARIKESDHHLTHAAQSFLASGLEESAILVVDAVGEWSTCSIAKGRWHDGKPVIEMVAGSEYPHSLGLVYSAFTEFLGFTPMNDECSTMALAAFGRPRFRETVERVLAMDETGRLRLDTEYLQFDRFYSSPFTAKFRGIFGEPRRGGFRFSSFDAVDAQAASDEERHYADVAASVQAVFEDYVVRLACLAADRAGSRNLCYAGGGALNCVANTRIMRETGLNVFVPTEPGDGGAAIGAALLGYFAEERGTARRQSSPYLGASHAADGEMLRHVDVPTLRRFRRKGLETVYRNQWHWREFADETAFLQHLARRLVEGKSVGWMRGEFEFGPRALGNRSILFRPDDVELAKRISRDVKSRAPFRPYALAMTAEAARELLDWNDWQAEPLKWMQTAVPVKAERAAAVRAGLHVDLTTRPQVVEGNPAFEALLRAYAEASGAPACLINTSFNEADYPIVNHPTEGLLMFARTDLDVLAIDRLVIEKGI